MVANFGGSAWTAIMGLIFLPLYIHFIGIEAYGLVGIFATLLALFSLLDMGLSATLTREMARLAVKPDKSQEMRDLVRTLEIPYWLVGLLIAAFIVGASSFITYHWVNLENISPNTVKKAIMLMGLVIAFQWPVGLYTGGLIGLQRQVLLNSINVVMATFRGLGAVLILWLVSPTVEAFFLWQALASAVQIGLMASLLWHSLPHAAQVSRFRNELLISIWRFAAGIMGITTLATILTQIDKVIVSRMLSLEIFGYYTLASAVATNLYIFIRPISQAVYPQLTNLVALGDTKEIKRLYHKSAQFIAVLLLPAALVIALFSKEILLLWTRSPVTSEGTHLLVSIIIMGTAFNGLMSIPYALQLATGWTRLTFFINLVAVILLVPLIIVLTILYGVVGAASMWVILNGGYLVIGIHLMHRRLLPAEKWRWYFKDTGLPFGVALLVTVFFRLMFPTPVTNVALIIYIAMISAVTLGATALATPVTRDWVWMLILNWRASHETKY